MIKSDYLQLFREEQPLCVSRLGTNSSASLNTSQLAASCSSVNNPLPFPVGRSCSAVSRPCREQPLRRPGSTGTSSASPLRNASEVTLRRQSDTGSSPDGSCRRGSQDSVFRRASVDSFQTRPYCDHSNRRTSDGSISSGGSSNSSTLPGGVHLKRPSVNSPNALETLIESCGVGTSRTIFAAASQISQPTTGNTATRASNKARRNVATCTDETLFSNKTRFKNPVARLRDADAKVVPSVATDDNGNECLNSCVAAVSQISGGIGWNVSTDVIPNVLLTKDKDSEKLFHRAQSQSFPLDRRLTEPSEKPTVFNVSGTVIPEVESSCSSHKEAFVFLPKFKSSKTSSNLASLALEDDESDVNLYPKSKHERHFMSESISPQLLGAGSADGPSVAMTTADSSRFVAHTPPGPLVPSCAAGPPVGSTSPGPSENRTRAAPSIARTASGPSVAGGVEQRSEERLYPCLRHLDGHREVFGPEELHPDVIAQKVRKLCRVTPERLPDRTLTCDSAVSTDSAVTKPSACLRNESMHVEKASMSSSNVGSRSSKHSNVNLKVELGQNVHESLERTSSPEKVFNGNIKQLHTSDVRICGEVIRPEVEDGKKVIFIVGDDEELDQPARQPQQSFNTSKEPSSMISCMPHPHDFREVREARLVSKAVSPDFYLSRNLMPESAGSFVRCASERKLRREHASRHKRTRSDPLAKRRVGPPVASDSDVTKIAQASVAMCSASAPCMDRAVQTETCSTDDFIEETQFEPFRWLQTPTVEVSGADHPCGVAESILGGVLDHYSPVFVVQAVVNTDMHRPASSASRTGCPTSVSVPSFIRGTEVTVGDDGTPLCGGEDSVGGGSVSRLNATTARPTPSAAREVNRASTGQGALSFTSTLFSTSPNRFFTTLSNRSYFSSLGPSASSSRDESVGQLGSSSFEGTLTGVRNTNNASATSSCKRELLTSLRRDLEVDSRYSSPKVNHVAIVADVDDWSVNVISGSGCVPVGMSPLVAGITDALLQLVQLNATPEMVTTRSGGVEERARQRVSPRPQPTRQRLPAAARLVTGSEGI